MWSLPKHISQSTLDGRQGSNACTLIALIVGRNVAYTPALYTPRNEPLPDTILKMIMQSIREGNRIHDIKLPWPGPKPFGGRGQSTASLYWNQRIISRVPCRYCLRLQMFPGRPHWKHYLQSINQKQVCVFIRGAASVVFFKKQHNNYDGRFPSTWTMMGH